MQANSNGFDSCSMSTDSVFTIAPASLALGAVLARGSPGITLYKADLMLGQRTVQVAVKRLCTSGAPLALELAFMKEIQVLQLAASTCQHVCRMLGCCKLSGDPCIVMSLYPKSAAKMLEDNAGPVCIPELVSLAVEILEGLTELHAANIWHLDLKPPNILLDQYGHAYLSDFGISHALRTLEACTVLTTVAGTPHYMAPEQADAEFGARGPHSDVWGFATTMLHLATGEQPYKDLTLVQMVTAMIKSRPPTVPNTLPAWLQQLLRQCFSFDVTQRPPIQHLLQVFKEQLKQGQGIPAPSTSHQQMLTTSAVSPAPAQAQQASQHSIAVQARALSQGRYADLMARLQSNIAFNQEQAAIKVMELSYDSRANTRVGSNTSQATAIIAAGALPLLVALLQSDKSAVQEAAAHALRSLAIGSVSNDEQNKEAIIAAGAVPLLVALLRPYQPEVQRRATQALEGLAEGSQLSRDAIIAAGALPCLVALLRSDHPEANVPYTAAATLKRIAEGSQHNKNAIIAAGAMPLLVEVSKRSQCWRWHMKHPAQEAVALLKGSL